MPPVTLNDPGALAEFFQSPAFQLPLTPEAQLALRRLQLGGATGLEEFLVAPPGDERRRIEEALFGRTAETLGRTASELRREAEEAAYARGVGKSTMLRGRLSDIDRELLDATERARREAVVGAGAEVRADQQARLAAIGQALSGSLAGLQGEANIGLTEAARRQEARQRAGELAVEQREAGLGREQQAGLQREAFGLERELTGQRLGQQAALQREGFGLEERLAQSAREQQAALQREGFGLQRELTGAELAQRGALQREGFGLERELQTGRLGQQERLQQEAFQTERDIARNQLLATGIAAGVGGLADIFGPSIRKYVGGLFGE